MKRLAVPLAAVMLSAFVLAPAAASASTAEVNRSTLAIYYRTAPGEANRLSATTTGDFPRSGSVTFSDPGASITPGNGCTGSTAHVVICAFDFGASGIVSLGDGDDSAQLPSTPALDYWSADGGTGSDSLTVGTAAISGGELHGGAGDDVLNASASDDQLDGGAGDDLVSGNAGNDTINGGASHPACVR